MNQEQFKMSFPRDNQKPFIIALATSQMAGAFLPSRYDSELDELMVLSSTGWRPAVDSDEDGPATKKKDIEKGEDLKDKWW